MLQKRKKNKKKHAQYVKRKLQINLENSAESRFSPPTTGRYSRDPVSQLFLKASILGYNDVTKRVTSRSIKRELFGSWEEVEADAVSDACWEKLEKTTEPLSFPDSRRSDKLRSKRIYHHGRHDQIQLNYKKTCSYVLLPTPNTKSK